MRCGDYSFDCRVLRFIEFLFLVGTQEDTVGPGSQLTISGQSNQWLRRSDFEGCSLWPSVPDIFRDPLLMNHRNRLAVILMVFVVCCCHSKIPLRRQSATAARLVKRIVINQEAPVISLPQVCVEMFMTQGGLLNVSGLSRFNPLLATTPS